MGLGFWVKGFGVGFLLRVLGLEFWVLGLEFWVLAVGFGFWV